MLNKGRTHRRMNHSDPSAPCNSPGELLGDLAQAFESPDAQFCLDRPLVTNDLSPAFVDVFDFNMAGKKLTSNRKHYRRWDMKWYETFHSAIDIGFRS